MGARASKETDVEQVREPEISPEELKRLKHRARISEEVVDTERSYSNSLDTCVQGIIAPLYQKGDGTPNISADDLRRMFFNLETVNATHKNFLEELVNLIQQESARFGPLFVKYAMEFKIVYSSYVNDYNEAVTVLSKLRKHKPDFDEYLEVTAKEVNCQGIASVMIMPVQRLPRYVLLLADLLKYTSKDDLDYTETEKALQTMKETTDFVNKEKQIAEQQNEIMDIQSTLTSESELLINRERYVVSRGNVRILKKDKEYHYILFNDLILFAAEQRISLTSIWAQKKFKEKDRALLTSTAISMKDPGNRVAVLRTPNRKWIMKFKTEEDYETWIEVYEKACRACPEKKVKRKLSYVLDTKGQTSDEKSTLIAKPETEGNCSCCIA